MSTPIHPQTVVSPAVQFVSGDGTTKKTLFTPGSLGGKLESISCTSDDTSAVVFQLGVTISAVDYILGEVNIPVGSGTNGTAESVDVLNSTDFPWLRNDGVNNYMLAASGAVLYLRAKTAITASKTVQFFSQGGNF